MDIRVTKHYQSLLRLRDFGIAYSNRLADDTLADAAFKAIADAISVLDTFGVQRLAARSNNARARAVSRAELLDMMESISQTARLLQEEDPQFPNTFLMPERSSAVAVLTAARLFARDVVGFAAKFKAHSLGATFPENFNQLVARYEQAVSGRETDKTLTAGALEGIAAAIASGRTAARRLDIIVARELRDDPVAIGAWQRARRLGFRGDHRTDADVTQPVTPATSPPSPVALGPTAEPPVSAVAAPQLDPAAGGVEEEVAAVGDAPPSPETAAPVSGGGAEVADVSNAAAAASADPDVGEAA